MCWLELERREVAFIVISVRSRSSSSSFPGQEQLGGLEVLHRDLFPCLQQHLLAELACSGATCDVLWAEGISGG